MIKDAVNLKKYAAKIVIILSFSININSIQKMIDIN